MIPTPSHTRRLITRFAPSPTGPLHLGHAYSALLAADIVKGHGTFLLRIEDIDQSRARPAWEAQIYDDLHWLGLRWPEPVMRQSDRLPAYQAALDHLWKMGLLYPCTCSRSDIAEAASAPQEGAPLNGPDGLIYPGTCRSKPRPEQRPSGATLRLDMARAVAQFAAGDPSINQLGFTETGTGHRTPTVIHLPDLVTQVGDCVLARKDMGTSYHLSVVVDDAAQGVSLVVRGHDLADATGIHVILQDLLGLPRPDYHHHHLIRDAHGKRLAKRDDARALSKFRAEGATPNDIRKLVGLPTSFG